MPYSVQNLLADSVYVCVMFYSIQVVYMPGNNDVRFPVSAAIQFNQL